MLLRRLRTAGSHEFPMQVENDRKMDFTGFLRRSLTGIGSFSIQHNYVDWVTTINITGGWKEIDFSTQEAWFADIAVQTIRSGEPSYFDEPECYLENFSLTMFNLNKFGEYLLRKSHVVFIAEPNYDAAYTCCSITARDDDNKLFRIQLREGGGRVSLTVSFAPVPVPRTPLRRWPTSEEMFAEAVSTGRNARCHTNPSIYLRKSTGKEEKTDGEPYFFDDRSFVRYLDHTYGYTILSYTILSVSSGINKLVFEVRDPEWKRVQIIVHVSPENLMMYFTKEEEKVVDISEQMQQLTV